MKKQRDSSLKYEEKDSLETEVKELRDRIVSSQLERSRETETDFSAHNEFLGMFHRLLRLIRKGEHPPLPEGYRIVQKEKLVLRLEDVFVVQRERRFLWWRWWHAVDWHFSKELVHEKTLPRLGLAKPPKKAS